MSDTGAAPSRAGFWRRFFALLIDVCLITLVLGMIGFLLFMPTAGAVRVSSMLINSQSCIPADVKTLSTLDLGLPANLQVTHAARCTRTLLGHVFDRILVVSEVSRSGAVTSTRGFQFPVDTEGRPMHAFYLDNLSAVLLPIFLIVTQWRFGRTLGQDLMDIRVRSLTGEPASLVQVLKRVLLLLSPVVLLDAWTLSVLLFGVVEPWLAIFVPICLAAIAIAIAINAILTVRHGNLAWHDQFAGTEVISGR